MKARWPVQPEVMKWRRPTFALALLVVVPLAPAFQAQPSPSSEKRRNNLVAELLQVFSISGSNRSFGFNRSSDGWTFFSTTGEGDGTLRVIRFTSILTPMVAQLSAARSTIPRSVNFHRSMPESISLPICVAAGFAASTACCDCRIRRLEIGEALMQPCGSVRNAIWNKAGSRSRHYLQDVLSGKVAELSERKL